MLKPKTIKLKVEDRQEMDRLQFFEIAASYGVETAHRLHSEAKERLWEAMCRLYPELEKNTNIEYQQGVITYTPEKEKT